MLPNQLAKRGSAFKPNLNPPPVTASINSVLPKEERDQSSAGAKQTLTRKFNNQPKKVPVCPHGKDCALINKGRCLLDHSKPPSLPEMPALRSTLATHLALSQTEFPGDEVAATLSKISFESLDGKTLSLISQLLERGVGPLNPKRAQFMWDLHKSGFVYESGLRKAILKQVRSRSNQVTDLFGCVSLVDSILTVHEITLLAIPILAGFVDPPQLSEFVCQFSETILGGDLSLPVMPGERASKETVLGFKNRVERLSEMVAAVLAPKADLKADPLPTDPLVRAALEEDNHFVIRAPTDDFRNIKLFIEPADINAEPILLRRIRVASGYKSCEEYLDTHFRLLWEDFYASVRRSLIEYKAQRAKDGQKTRVESLTFFKGETFFLTSIRGVVCLKVVLDMGRRFRLNPRRFIYGSMLLLSINGFEDFVAVKVWDKNLPDLRKNGVRQARLELLVEPLDPRVKATDLADRLKGKPLEAAEVCNYFESYFHCLKRMQVMGQVPLQRLIVQSDKRLNERPRYLCKASVGESGERVWSLAPKVQAAINSIYARYTVDDTQKLAIEEAFSRELAIIQGPPGTGKTFVSVRIVEALLQLKDRLEGPIMVICDTNHALDQFLGHISRHTQSIVRMGGRSKDPHLTRFTIPKLKESGGMPKSTNAGFHFMCKSKMEECFNLIASLGNLLISVKVAAISPSDWNDLLRTYVTSIEKYSKGTLAERMASKTKMTANLQQIDELFHQHELDIGEGYQAMEDVQLEFEDRFVSMCYEAAPFEMKFKEFYEQRVRPLPLFAQAVLSWLGVLDLRSIFQEWNQERRREYKNPVVPTPEEEEEALWEEAEEALYQETNYLPEDNLTRCLMKQPNYEALLSSPPLSRELRAYGTVRGSIERKRDGDMASQEDSLEGSDNSSQEVEFPWEQDEGSLGRRWMISDELVGLLRTCAGLMVEHLAAEITAANQRALEFEDENLAEFLGKAAVVGVTTTGAAMFTQVLRRVASRVTVVEEAAEVLESHVITSLTGSLAHLILVGDHKQLRPKVCEMDLARDYFLEVSLFERLVGLGFPRAQLLTQRRMRPEIADITRLFYPDLRDDPSVGSRASVRGIGHNIFFFSHDWPEEGSQGSESKVNLREANFIIRFAAYLIKNNYRPEDIVVLSLYAGQLLHIKTEMARNEHLKAIRVCTVDDFQGEEGTIVLLSLVRSNSQGRIGFLKFDNRINVAFSRARDGLFVFGSARTIRHHFERTRAVQPHLLLQRIIVHLSDKGLLDTRLEVACRAHKNVTVVEQPEDFDRCPDGGCHLPCNTRQLCGHVCPLFCHDFEVTLEDRDGHERLLCTAPCKRKSDCGHPCGKSCGQCRRSTFHCKAPFVVAPVACGHQFEIDCGHREDPVMLRCPKPCEKILGCGHRCLRRCWEPCSTLTSEQQKMGWLTSCTFHVEVQLPCGHPASKPCGQPMELFRPPPCHKPCAKPLSCDHLCPGKCSDCRKAFGGTEQFEHRACEAKCRKQLLCGHECQDRCTTWIECSLCPKACPFRCEHQKCSKRCNQSCDSCPNPCENKCEHRACSLACGEPCDVEPCLVPCPLTLKCGHPCLGNCGDKCPQLCRVCDPTNQTLQMEAQGPSNRPETVVQLPCNHSFPTSVLDSQFHADCSPSELLLLPICPQCQAPVYLFPRYKRRITIAKNHCNAIKEIISAKISAYVSTSGITARSMAQPVSIKSPLSDFTYKFPVPLKTHSKKDFPVASLNAYRRFKKIVEVLESILKYATSAAPPEITEPLKILFERILKAFRSKKDLEGIGLPLKHLTSWLILQNALREARLSRFKDSSNDTEMTQDLALLTEKTDKNQLGLFRPDSILEFGLEQAIKRVALRYSTEIEYVGETQNLPGFHKECWKLGDDGVIRIDEIWEYTYGSCCSNFIKVSKKCQTPEKPRAQFAMDLLKSEEAEEEVYKMPNRSKWEEEFEEF